jgi:hypothetical protein
MSKRNGMKTAKTTGLGFILVLLVCFTVICGCKEEGSGGNDVNAHALGTFPGLDAKTEKRILQEFFKTYVKPEDTEAKATVNDIRITGYFGTYNGVVIVRFGGYFGYADVITVESVAGINFTYPNPKPNLAWKDGILYRLQEAYDLGLLTDEDVKNIHEKYYADLMGGNIHE